MAGVLAVAVLVELAAPSFVEARVEEHVRQRARDVAAVNADVDSFPLVTRLLVTGRIRRLTLTLDQVLRREVTFATVRFRLEGLELDRDALLQRREVELRDIETGVVTVELTAETLSDLVGTPVELRSERVSVDVGGATLTARPEIRGRTLQLAGRGIAAVSVALPDDLLTCPPRVDVEPGRLVLSCRIDDLPSVLIGARGRHSFDSKRRPPLNRSRQTALAARLLSTLE